MSAQSQSSISIKIVQKLTQIRKKRFKIVVCFPYLKYINNYFISRCTFSIYIFAKGYDKEDRGYFRAYSALRTEILYNLMKLAFKYNFRKAFRFVPCNFPGRFGKEFPIDYDKYDNKKDKSRQEGDTDSFKEQFIQTLHYIKLKKGKFSIVDLAGWLGKSKQYLYSLVKQSQGVNKVDNIVNVNIEDKQPEGEDLSAI